MADQFANNKFPDSHLFITQINLVSSQLRLDIRSRLEAMNSVFKLYLGIENLLSLSCLSNDWLQKLQAKDKNFYLSILRTAAV
jgi:hypothetical protein